jgi:subtilisin family serine protease
VNSAGNEGNSTWRYITAPADGPQVLAVGAINDKNQVSSFSSRGPTADDRIKPDVVALGEQVYGASTGTVFTTANGTSVSCPLVAGIAAQLLQSKPELNIFELLSIIKNSADNSGSPDNDRGWGKVNALAAWNLINQDEITDFRMLPPTPNPLYSGNFSVFFPVELPVPATIHLEIFTVLGQRIYESNYSGTVSQNLITWDTRKSNGSTVAAGMYIYRISAGSWKYTGKLTILN